MMLYVVIDFGYAKYSCHLMSVEFSVVFKIGCLFAESKEPPGPEMSPVGLSRWAACRTGTLRGPFGLRPSSAKYQKPATQNTLW
jgi:hypothetical protein